MEKKHFLISQWLRVIVVVSSAIVFFGAPYPVRAACNLKTINNASLTSSVCSVDSSTIEGVDTAITEGSTTNTAALTLTNSSITLNSNSTLVVGQIVLTGTSTISTLASGSKIEVGHGIWVTDADADGWAANFTLYDASASGRRRLALMRSTTTVDCNDNNYNVSNSCCIPTTWYADADGDGYGNPNVTQSSCTQPIGYVANNLDCYDANANAHPGSIYCSTVNRGDGSFDYNCSGSQTACGTVYNIQGNGTTFIQGRACNRRRCGTIFSRSINAFTYGSVSCGTSGYSCTGTSTIHVACQSDCTNLDATYCVSISASGTQACQ